MDLKDFITSLIVGIIKPLTWLILSLAVVYFLWNIMQIIRKSDEPDALEKLKRQATWGIVAIFVMVSLWGLVNILVNTFRPSTELNPLPLLPTSSSGVGGGGTFGVPRTSVPASSRGTSGGSTAGSSSGSTFNVPRGGACGATSDCAQGLVCKDFTCR